MQGAKTVAVSEENEVTDEVDRANEQAEMTIQSARLRRAPSLPATGQCYNCESDIPAGVFCDADCRDDYEKRTRGKVAK